MLLYYQEAFPCPTSPPCPAKAAFPSPCFRPSPPPGSATPSAWCSTVPARDGAIQRFEFCAELAWKAAQNYMQAQGYLDVHSPKAVMRKAYAEHIITDEDGWLALLDARNQTSHLYDDAVADAVYQAIGNTYLPLLRELSEKLSAAV